MKFISKFSHPLNWLLLIPLSLAVVDFGYASDWIKVKYVNDGDTVVLTNGRHIRYLGINAPEIAHGGKGHKTTPAEPFGDQARRYNEALVLEKKIRLELDAEKYDRYGRLLAYVYLPDGEMVNAKMLRKGLAYCLTKPPNVRYQKRFKILQQKAIRALTGIWRLWQKGSGPVTGNKRSFRFHRNDCIAVKEMHKNNKIGFASMLNAFYEGYAPCKKCVHPPGP